MSYIPSCAYQWVKNVRFSENLTCFVFFKHPFWDSPFCLITDDTIEQWSQNKNIYNVKCYITTKLKSRKGLTIQTLWYCYWRTSWIRQIHQKNFERWLFYVEIIKRKIKVMFHIRHLVEWLILSKLDFRNWIFMRLPKYQKQSISKHIQACPTFFKCKYIEISDVALR